MFTLINESCHLWRCHVTHCALGLLWRVRQWLRFRYRWNQCVMSRIPMSHVTHRSYLCIMSRIWMRHVTHRWYLCVMSRIPISHVTHRSNLSVHSRRRSGLKYLDLEIGRFSRPPCWETGLRFLTWNQFWKIGDSRENVIDMYGDSRENLLEFLAVVIPISSVCGMSHLWLSHVTLVNESCHTYEWVMSHLWMSHVTLVNESCHTYEWVMSHSSRSEWGKQSKKRKKHHLTCGDWAVWS